MKKICITFFASITLLFQTAHGGECLIQNDSSPALLEYVKNTKQVISNLSSVSSDRPGETKQASQQAKSIINQVIDWDSYHNYFDYYVSLPLRSEVPKEIKRDYEMLEKLQENINDHVYRIARTTDIHAIASNACSGVSQGCDLEDQKTKKILETLVVNHNHVMNYYRQVVMQDIRSSSDWNKEILFVSQNFSSEIIQYYGGDTIKTCALQEGSFFDRVWKTIGEFELINQQAEDGIDLWIEQKNRLLNINKGNKEQEQAEEARLLKKELSRQGVTGSKKEKVLQSLEDFNSQGTFSSNNNPLSNSFQYLSSNIGNQFGQFSHSIQELWNKGNDGLDTDLKSLYKTQKDKDIEREIKHSIETLYNYQLPYAIQSQQNSEELRFKIIQLHERLKSSNNTLQKTCKYAVKSCQEQGFGLGNCGQCQ